jgi:hypothetical protein
MLAAEMIGVRTGERIEFNPQKNVLGKVVGRPWSPPRQVGDKCRTGRVIGTI